MERIRAEFPREQWPVTRTYTVRAWDPSSPRADPRLRGPRRRGPRRAVGGARPAGRAGAVPGPRRRLRAGPGGRLASAGRRRERPAGDRRLAGGAARRAPRCTPSSRSPDPRRSRRSTSDGGGRLAAPRRPARSARRWSRPYARWSSPTGRVHAFVHGEAGFVKELRRLPARRARRSRARSCRSPATGASARTRTAGGRQARVERAGGGEQEGPAAARRRLRDGRSGRALRGDGPPGTPARHAPTRGSHRPLVRPERPDRQPHRRDRQREQRPAPAEHVAPVGVRGHAPNGPPPSPS